VRIHPGFLAAALAVACRPSASVERTTPVANLQIYRSVGLKVGAVGGAGDQAPALEQAVIAEIQRRCEFESVRMGTERGPDGPDLLLDLTIQRSGRGGDGLVQNMNQAMLDVLLVLSDGVDGELVGSALIKGRSSAVLVDGSNPEEQAAEVVSKPVGDMLDQAGCRGPRIARPTPEAPPTPPVATGGADAGAGQVAQAGDAGVAAPVATDEQRRADADAANEAGKQKFRTGDPTGALADFRRAMELIRDARYAMNVCLAHEALEQWDQATRACDDVLAMEPPAALADKARQRKAIIAQRRGG
jgi:hypothetical protein